MRSVRSRAKDGRIRGGEQLVLDSEADRDRERARLRRRRGRSPETFTRRKGHRARTGAPISRPTASDEPGHVRGSAGEDDLPDPERARLSLVEVQRGHELARERGESALNPLVSLRALLDREPLDRDRLRERELPLDRLDLARGLVELPRDRDVERPPPSRGRA